MNYLKLIFILLILSNKIYAQNLSYNKFIRKSFIKADAGINKAGMHFETGNYTRCLVELQRVEHDSPGVNYNMALCNILIGESEKGITHLEKCAEVNYDYPLPISYLLGKTYHRQNQFAEAIKYYNQSMQSVSEETLLEEIRLNIFQAKNGIESKEVSSKNVLVNALITVNTKNEEYGIVFTDDQMYYHTLKCVRTNLFRVKEEYVLEKILIANFNDEEILPEEELVINVKSFEDVVILGKFQGKFILSFHGRKKIELFLAEINNGKFKRKTKWDPGFKDFYKVSSICFSNDNSEMFFSATHDGKSGIYVASVKDDQSYSEPICISKSFAGIDNIKGVKICNRDCVLYFSGDGKQSIGGFDLFEIERKTANVWSKPVNLGYPINSGANEITPNFRGDKLFFASDRDGGKGKFDLYTSDLTVLESSVPLPVPNKEEIRAQVENSIVIVQKQNKKEPEKDDRNIEEIVTNKNKLWFCVEIAAHKEEIQIDELRRRYKGDMKISYFIDDKGWYRYIIGDFKSFDKAFQSRKDCKVWDAFILAFDKNKITPIYQCREIDYQKKKVNLQNSLIQKHNKW